MKGYIMLYMRGGEIRCNQLDLFLTFGISCHHKYTRIGEKKGCVIYLLRCTHVIYCHSVFFIYFHSILFREDFVLDIICNFCQMGNFVKTEAKNYKHQIINSDCAKCCHVCWPDMCHFFLIAHYWVIFGLNRGGKYLWPVGQSSEKNSE